MGVSLKKEVKKLQKEIKSLQKMTASKPEINGTKYFKGFQKSLIRIAKLKKTRFYGYSSVICVEQTLDKTDFEQLFDGKDEYEPTPPPQKRRRRSCRIKQQQNTEDEDEESEDSDIENNANNKITTKWQTKMSQLKKENVSLKKEVKKLQKEIKS